MAHDLVVVGGLALACARWTVFGVSEMELRWIGNWNFGCAQLLPLSMLVGAIPPGNGVPPRGTSPASDGRLNPLAR
jgi:hypothetical protein